MSRTGKGEGVRQEQDEDEKGGDMSRTGKERV